MKKFLVWIFSIFGHSFSAVDVLMFKIESEGRCYTVNTLTGERKPLTGQPEITCRRCGKVFSQKQNLD